MLMAVMAFALTHVHAQMTVSLAGEWELVISDAVKPPFPDAKQSKAATADSSAVDAKRKAARDYVQLPGSLLTNGKGDAVSVNTRWTGSLYDSSFYFNPYMERYRQEGNVKFPFFLTPERHFVGNAWYRRSVYVPADWTHKRIMLFLERPHIETTVFVNGREVGHQMSLSTPHIYDVTKELKIGHNNEIAIRVYNGIENVCVGQDSHSVTDQTQGNWNGIVGRMELQARPRHVNIRSARVYPSLAKRTAHVVVQLENNSNPLLGDLHVLQIREYVLEYDLFLDGIKSRKPLASSWKELHGNTLEFDIHLPNVMAWSEFKPAVYRLKLYAGEDTYETTFGFRDISVDGRQMLINDRPLFIRGTVENCCFPETGYPPTSEEEWIRIFTKCREYGLNMVRFHSYCPPEAAFSAADRLGIYLQPEGPSWPNHGVKLGRGMAIDQYLLDESRRIIDTYGNHPSFVMMAAGNEPAGDWVTYCNKWVRQMHEYDSTKVYCGASVGGGWAWDSGSEYHVKGGARGLDWDRHAPSSADNYYEQIQHPKNYKPDTSYVSHSTSPFTTFDSKFSNQSPIIAHEQGQWCAFPDLKETSQYTGAYKARNFEIFADLLRDNGMASRADSFLMASGRLQTLCYKYEIERNLRTPDYTGFQLLSLNDYSGQGTALVGPLNVHWKEKGYVDAEHWRQFCSVLVPLARFPRFVYTTADTLKVPVEVYNADESGFANVRTSYYIKNDTGAVLGGGILSVKNIIVGKNNQAGTVVKALDSIAAPAKLTLVVQLAGKVSNEWDFWVYPDSCKAIGDNRDAIANNRKLNDRDANNYPYISDSLDARALDVLRQGGSVLLTAAGRVTLGSDVKQTYLPVFWRPPHTTGAYIDTSHPLFRHGFPTDSWANLNWWELLNKAQVMDLTPYPTLHQDSHDALFDYQPAIQPIDTWHISRKLAMLIEARVAGGRLLMTTMDISTDLDRRVVARQMRQAILSYMQSDDFQPSLILTAETISDFFHKQAPPVRMFTNESPDELKPKLTNDNN